MIIKTGRLKIQAQLHLYARILILLLAYIVFSIPSLSFSLEPDEVLVLANKSSSDSLELATYYMKKRGVPADQLLKLSITNEETCSREDYDRKVLSVLQKHLAKNDPEKKIRCLVTMYGLPLRVLQPVMTREEKIQLEKLKKKQASIREELKGLSKDQLKEREVLTKQLSALGKQGTAIYKNDQRASFDSELSLALANSYPLDGWIANPYFLGFKDRKPNIPKAEVFMVSRLDGPDAEIVRRMIDDSLYAEKTGLQGKAYFDAKGPKPDVQEASKSASSFYDRSLHLAAEKVEKSGLMAVLTNDTSKLFQPGECPDAALYAGWYSRKTYIDAFEWQPGAVGYHIASDECTTLKNKKSRVWCKMMIEDGAAATLGPTSEPYLQAFPLPEIFFGLLIEGYYTLAESYILSLPYLSWQMVLVGDPLYRPFMHKRDSEKR
jgi:uncharacterized protein (TIGR03790 family)